MHFKSNLRGGSPKTLIKHFGRPSSVNTTKLLLERIERVAPYVHVEHNNGGTTSYCSIHLCTGQAEMFNLP